MKFFICLSLCLASFYSNAQEFTNLNGRFKISSPSYLEEKIDSVETDLGILAYHTFFYQNQEGKNENQIYMVSYCDYPEGIVFADSVGFASEFLASTMEAATESVGGELRYQSDINLNGHPGKLWRIDFNGGDSVIKTKAYLVGNRYYAIQTISYYNKQSTTEMDRFLDSFKLF